MTDDLAVSLTYLTKRFDEIVAVNGLNFDVPHGEVFGLLGHNGAGKTTTVRLLNGVLRPSEGRIKVLGLDPTTEGPELRKRTGVLTETPSLDERLTARENLAIFAEFYGIEGPAQRVDALLDRFGLLGRAEEKTGGYSKGMKQRLALARALMHEPEVIFLDEPTAGLDPVAAREVRDLIAHLSREEGRTVFIATHNLPEAQRLCDRLAVLERGRVLALGTLAELGARLGARQRLALEVEAGTVAQARSAIEGLPGVTDITTEGDTLSFAGAPRERIPDLIRQLAAQGVRIVRANPEEPSLEEMYFALHEGGDR